MRIAHVPALAMTVMAFLLSACASTINSLVPTGSFQFQSAAYGQHSRQGVDIYSPRNAKDAPVVVFFYGGRWEKGKKADYRFVGEALASHGYVAMIPDYRVYPELKFPTFVEDGAQAVRWAREHAHEYGGNPGRLFVMGHSAGAHIAAMLALDGEFLARVGGSREWLSGMIGLAGAYDFLPFTDDDIKAIFGPPERYAQTQPINFVDGHNPPILLLHGKTDTTVYPKNSINLAARIKEKGGQVTTIIYPVMSHVRIVACMAAPIRFTGHTLDDVSAFINEHVGQPVPIAAQVPINTRDKP